MFFFASLSKENFFRALTLTSLARKSHTLVLTHHKINQINNIFIITLFNVL